MKLEFYNCPQAVDISTVKLPKIPEFVTYKPDFELIKKYQNQYKDIKNILIIGNGGSTNCFIADYYPLRYQSTKEVYILNSVDPDYIFELKQKLKPSETLVIAVSKSGENTTQIESMLAFAKYPMLIMTSKSSPLRALAEKLKVEVVTHPPIGGRYNSLTEVALLPAALCGLDVEGLFKGAEVFYGLYNQNNLAFKAASILFQIEQAGYVDVFMPFYSKNLFPLSTLVVQLCHESFGKAGVGQTYVAFEAPESQHHTNQRFFGGRKNMAGFFTTTDNFLHPTVNVFPTEVHSVQVKGHHLFDIDKIPLEKSMGFEASATMEDARINGIPLLHLSISSFAPSEIGSLIAFWQLYAVYASVLRGVDPFDQPQVEASKKISFDKRLAFKGLL